LPSHRERRYRNALLLRATIVLGLGLAFGRRAEAAEPEASPPAAAEGSTTPSAGGVGEEVAQPRPGSVAPKPSALPDQPFGGDSDQEADDEDKAEAGASEEEEPGAPLRALSCLEGEGGNERDGARRGVQKRDFLKKHRFELAALGGAYASDALSSTYVYGGAASFFFSEDFGIEAMVLRNPVSYRLQDPIVAAGLLHSFKSGMAWNGLAAMLWSPVHAKLRFSARHITHADLLIVAGAGQTLTDAAQGLTFQVGIGLKLYLARFVSLRIDVRDLIIPQEVLGHAQNTHNVITMFGVCGWVPG
jgi:outer membrane beta-barrel protein